MSSDQLLAGAPAALRPTETDALDFLVEAGVILSSSLDYEATLTSVAHLVVPRLADWCVVHLIGGSGKIEQLTIAHADPAKVQWARELQERYPSDPEANNGIANVLRTHQSQLYAEIPEEMLVAAARDAEHLALLRSVGMASAMIVPLVARDRTLGTLSLVWARPGKHYSADDLMVVEQLARQCALAVDNARLYQELERRVAERTAALQAANQELEAFSYSVSHDLRAPLRAVDGFSRILIDDYAPELSAEARRYLHRVRDGAQRMGQLVDGLLAFSRLGRQALVMRPVAPADIVRRALAELAGECEGRHVEIVTGELPPCQADPTLLMEVYLNLLSNALKYTRGRDPARIEVGALKSGTAVAAQTYFVKDNGVGFDMSYADKLFGVF